MTSTEVQEIRDADILDALDDYGFICPGDTIEVYLKEDVPNYGRTVKGILFSIYPVFQVMCEGQPVSIERESIVLKTVLKSSKSNRFAAIVQLREQMRKFNILSLVARGAYMIPPTEGDEKGSMEVA